MLGSGNRGDRIFAGPHELAEIFAISDHVLKLENICRRQDLLRP